MNEIAGGGSIDGAAQRIARTLDLLSNPIGVSYAVREAAPEKFGSGGVAEVREILRLDPGQPPDQATVTHRIFHLPYHAGLNEERHPNAIRQALRLAWSWFLMMLRFVRAVLMYDAVSKRQKLALFVGGIGLLLVTTYLLIILGAIAHVVLNLGESAGASGGNAAAGDFSAVVAQFDEVLDGFFGSAWTRAFGVLTLLGLTSGTLRRKLELHVQTYLDFWSYFDSSEARATCTGRFNELLEHILGGAHARVDVIAYSLGSLVTMDALFPADGQAPRRAAISTLTTIGCPFDFVRTFWPDYFGNRSVDAPALSWFNVYSPVDLLGSNFTNTDGLAEKPTHGINAADPRGEETALRGRDSVAPEVNLYYDPLGRRNLSLWEALMGGAYRAHAQYWVPDQPAAESCYKRFVPLVYPPVVPGPEST